MRLRKHGKDSHDETDHGNWARGSRKISDVFSGKPKGTRKKRDKQTVTGDDKRFQVRDSEGKSYMAGAAPGTPEWAISEARAKYRRATDIKGPHGRLKGKKRRAAKTKAIDAYEAAIKEAGKKKQYKDAIANERANLDKHAVHRQKDHGNRNGKTSQKQKDYERARRRAEMRRKAASRDEAHSAQEAIEANADLINRRLNAHYRTFNPKGRVGSKKAARMAAQKKLAKGYAAFRRGTRKTDPTESWKGDLTKTEIRAAKGKVDAIFAWGSKVQREPARGSISAGDKKLTEIKGGKWVESGRQIKDHGDKGMGKYKWVNGERVYVGTADKTTIDPMHYDAKSRRVKPTGKVKRPKK